MATKLGELLLQEHLITQDQLDEALDSQMTFGIKLGSSLIELGFITEEQLCGLLSKKLGVPAITPRTLSSVPQEVLDQVPAELAGKYRVIPIRIEGKKLALAMADPTDFKATDDVAFVTGYIILPHIAPDVWITSALSRYYHVRGDIRYLMIEGILDSKRKAARSKKTDKIAEKMLFPMMNNEGELFNIEIPLEFEGFANLPGYDEERAAVVAGVERYSFEQLSREFASARNRDQIATLFITYLGLEFRTGALFIIRNSLAVGWRGIVAGKRIEELESLSVLLNKPSVLRDVRETRQYVMGMLAQTPANDQLLKILECDPATPFLALPIVMLKKVVAVVIVSAEMDALGTRLQELQKLVQKAALAFEMLIIKNKILQT
jgi:hypothetical protein